MFPERDTALLTWYHWQVPQCAAYLSPAALGLLVHNEIVGLTAPCPRCWTGHPDTRGGSLPAYSFSDRGEGMHYALITNSDLTSQVASGM